MAKRGAANQMTHDNWDQEEEAEDAGIFKQASEEEMKSRRVIKAKRKHIGDSDSKPAFTGFGGFNFKPTQTSTPVFGLGGFKSESKIAPSLGKKETMDQDGRSGQSNSGSQGLNGADQSESDYLSHLKALNKSVLDWISSHVEKNPYCILTPIFKDYDTHLSQLDSKKKKGDSNGTAATTKETEKVVSEAGEEKPAFPKTGLTFAIGGLNTASSLMGSSDSKPPAFSGFSFNPKTDGPSSGGFSFAVGSSTGASTSAGTSGDKDDEYVPPKAETIEHEEEGSLFTKKCKLFYQKDGVWLEKGVGFLHLKKNDDKAQLLVRADNTLGNILLNIHLSEAIPASRQGKNNVSMVCILNPPIPKIPEDKPVPLLIRVKTGEDADELLEKIKEVRS